MRDGNAASRQFSSTEHLSTEAIAAFVDGELRMAAHMRAAAHIGECPACAYEVQVQQQARGVLREAAQVHIPTSLLGVLTQIPLGCGNAGEATGNRADSSRCDRRTEQSKRWLERWRK